MAENSRENRDTESFVLGLIVAAIIYLFFRREIAKLLGAGGGAVGGGKGSGGASAGNGSCGCSALAIAAPTNPGISIGNESFNYEPFASSSIARAPAMGGETFGTGAG
jgi:hypothetical protein